MNEPPVAALSAYRFLMGAAAAVIVLAGVRAFASYLVPFLLAILLAILCAPLIEHMAARGMSRILAFVTTLALVIVALVLLLGFLGFSALQLGQAIPGYGAEAQAGAEELGARLDALGLSAVQLSEYQNEIIEGVASAALGLIASLSDAVVSAFFMLFILAFLLLDYQAAGRRVGAVLGAGLGRELVHRFAAFTAETRSYMWIRTWSGAAFGVMVTALLWLLGVDFPILWGIVAFLTNFIPSVGFLLAIIPPTILALLESGVGTALLVVLGFSLLNGLIEYVILPRAVGQDLDMSPVTVFLSLMFWGFLLGPIGAFLSVPLSLLAQKVLFQSFDLTRPLAALMAANDDPPAPAAAAAEPGPAAERG